MRFFPSVIFCFSLVSAMVSPGQLIPRKPAAAPGAPSPAPETAEVPVPAGPAKPLKDEDLDRIIKQLAAIEANLQGTRSSHNTGLLTQLREAGAAEEKAFALWLDATKEIDFDEKGKSTGEFLDWKRGRGKEMHNAAFMTAVRLQCKYLAVLIVYSNALTDSARAEAIAGAVSYLDDLVSSAQKLGNRMDELNRGVLECVIAKHLKLDASMAKITGNDAYRPGNLQEIYEKAILPYYREKGMTSQLLAAWQKLISQETVMVEAEKVPEKLETFKKERLPVLKWRQAREMYDAGQEESAAASMLAVINANLGHKQAGAWIGEMTDILKAKREGGTAKAPSVGPASPAAVKSIPPTAPAPAGKGS